MPVFKDVLFSREIQDKIILLQHTNKNCFQEARVIDAIQEKRVLAILFADTSTRYSVLPKKGSVTVRDSGYPVCILLTFVLVLVIPVESE